MCISSNSIRVYNKTAGVSRVVQVSCNHCYECVRKRKLDWELRLTVESSASAHTFFGMLTYNDECYHDQSDVKEIQYYIKRLRYNLNKFYPGATLKYFLVSELGELKQRLHYHVLYMVSKEFDDTHREFEKLCELSWVKKVPLSDEQILYRKNLWKSYCKTHKDKLSDSYIEMRRFCRKKYDDISIGFATCQMLKGGTAIGSIHYACKYIQKQYNRKFHSQIGYDVWRRYMVESGMLDFDPTGLHPYKPKFIDYPTFPVRGFLAPVPKRWLINSVGKLYTQFLSQKLVKELSSQDKIINDDKVSYHWHKEPERASFLKEKDDFTRQSRIDLLNFRKILDTEFPFAKIEKEWQTIMIPKRTRSFQVDQNLTYPIETRLPLKWVN